MVGHIAKLPLHEQLSSLENMIDEVRRQWGLGNNALAETYLMQCKAYAQSIRSTTGAFAPPKAQAADAPIEADAAPAEPAEPAAPPDATDPVEKVADATPKKIAVAGRKGQQEGAQTAPAGLADGTPKPAGTSNPPP